MPHSRQLPGRRLSILLFSLTAILASPTVFADDAPKRFRPMADVTKDMQAIPGLFTLYRYNPADKNRDPERLLALIPRNLLETDLLFTSSISSGIQYSGAQWDSQLVQWQVSGNFVKLVTPNTHYIEKPGSTVSDVIQRTHTDGYLAAVPIESMNPDGSVLIDLNRLLKSDIIKVGQYVGGGVRPELSTWARIRNYADNVLIEANLALQAYDDGHHVGVAYGFRRLPKLGSYKPRKADPRIGYFVTAQVDWNKPPQAQDLFERRIERWQLEKTDPSLELSPPKEPIVFIIEDSVPIQWRRWVREGIDEWNKAFEKIGFDKAIVVHQQTKTNEYADYEPEDSRHNFIRWIVADRAFAMGPSTVDPRTGQILDADILFSDALSRANMGSLDVFAPANVKAMMGVGVQKWFNENPELVPHTLRPILEQANETSPQDSIWKAHQQRQMNGDHGEQDLAFHFQSQLAIAHYAMISSGYTGKQLPERLVGEIIKDTVTHEVGHTLGLRHNFKASSWLTLEEIKRRRNETDLPTSASVMDYNRLLFFADDELDKVRHFCTPTIGPYDELAIEYGYKIPQGMPEDKMLAEIAAKTTAREYRFGTDEDNDEIYTPDPENLAHDCSSTPIEWAKSRQELADKLMSNVREWAVKDGDPKYLLRDAFQHLYWERAHNYEFVARMVSGQYFSRSHKGDPDAPSALTLVEPAKQREALKVIGETIFNDEFWKVEPELLNDLPSARWYHWNSRPSTRIDYPYHMYIQMLQSEFLYDFCHPIVLDRIYDSEMKTTAEDKFTVAELLETTQNCIWSELEQRRETGFSNADPFISSISRNLQNNHLSILIMMAKAPPGASAPSDIHTMIRFSLRGLSKKIGEVLESRTVDFASEAHLVECKSRIDRMLDATFTDR